MCSSTKAAVPSGPRRRGQRVGVAADAGDALRQRLAVGVARGQHVGAELAAQGAAADARDAVVAGFFRQEVDDLERVLQLDAVFPHGVGDLDAGQHADDAVEAAAAHDGVAVRAGGDGLAVRVAAGAGADEVAAGVQTGGQTRGLEFTAQPVACLEEQRRKGAPGPGLVGQGVA